MKFLKGIKAIFLKDLICELRRYEILPATIVLAILIGWVFRLSLSSSLSNAATATAVIIVSSLFATILLSNKSFATEFSNGCIEALIMSPMDAGSLYLSKFLVNFVMLLIFQLFSVPVVCVLFGLNPIGKVFQLICVMLIMNGAFSSGATLLAAAMQESRGQNSLLSVVLMALLSPVIIPLIFVFFSVFNYKPEAMELNSVVSAVGSFGRAVGFIISFDAIFITASWLLFDFVVHEQEKL